MHRILTHPAFKKHGPQSLKFILCGLIGASIEFVSLLIMVERLGIDPHVAYIPSGLMSVTFVFFFNRYVTFKGGKDPAMAQTVRFVVVYSFAFFLNYVLASGFYRIGLWILPEGTFLYSKTYLLAKAGAIGIVAVMNYFLSHGFIFKKREVIELPL